MPGGSSLPIVSATAAQSNTGASAAAVTLTIASAGAGLFNYCSFLEVTMFAAAALVAAATPVLITTTGITGTPTISMSAPLLAQGAVEERLYVFDPPLKGSAAATAMTFVAPATTSTIWRLNAMFFTGY